MQFISQFPAPALITTVHSFGLFLVKKFSQICATLVNIQKIIVSITSRFFCVIFRPVFE